MAILRASKARIKTEDTVALAKEYERQQEKKRADEVVAQQKLEAAKRIQKANDARQKKSLIQRAIQTAAEGRFYFIAKKVSPVVKAELTELGLMVRSVNEDLKVLKSGLYEQWGFSSDISEDRSKLLEPLRRFLMITIVKAWRSRENDIEQIRGIASTLLKDYDDDLKSGRFSLLLEKMERLKKMSGDERHAEILLSDLFPTRESYVIARKSLSSDVFDIAIDVDTETEFFHIVGEIWGELDLDEYLKGVEVGLKQEAKQFSALLIDELKGVEKSSIAISWWSSYYVRQTEPKNFSEELFWLSSEHGQLFISQLDERITWAAEEGEGSLAITAMEGYGETLMVPVLTKYLASLGYKTECVDTNDGDVSIKISW